MLRQICQKHYHLLLFLSNAGPLIPVYNGLNLSHPLSWEFNKRQLASCFTGINPLVVLTRPPSLRDPAALQGCDWTGVSLS